MIIRVTSLQGRCCALGWIVFWVLLALILTILLFSLRVSFSVNGSGWHVTLRYGFIRILEKGSDVKPKPKADSSPPPDAEPEADAPEPAQDTIGEPPDTDEEDDSLFTGDAAEKPPKKNFFQKIKPTNLSEGKAFIGDIFASISPPLRLLTRHMHFSKINLSVDVAAGDAAKTAIMYGAVSGAAFWLLGQMQSLFDVTAEQYGVRADFLGEKTRFSVSGEYHSSGITLLCVLLGAGVRFLWRSFLRIRRQEREQKNNTKNQAAANESAAVG